MKAALLTAACLFTVACSDPVPEIGPGPFRGALLSPPSLDPLPVSPSELTEDVEVASAPALEVITEEAAPVPAELEEGHAAILDSGPEVDPEPEGEPTLIPESAPEVEEESAPVEIDPDEEVLQLNFDDMADFDYTPPTLDEIDNGTERPEQIPDEVLAFDKKLVEIEGYMIPIEVEQGKVKSFILSRTLSGCCFGDMPNIQEWVDVKMQDGKDADYIPYAPVLVIGRISVGELVDEYGITSIYRMTAESVEDPW